jgi:hypothetical protein
VSFPEAVRIIMKVMIVNGRQEHYTGPLDDLVLKCGLAYRPFLPTFLIDPYPLNRRGNITVSSQPRMQFMQVVFKVLAILFGCHLVYTGCPTLTGTTISLLEKFIVNQVVQVVEYHLRIAFSLLCYSLEFR